MSNSDLGTFLRACREAIAPEAAGLPSGTRRRTPGLRRAELATVAGVSVEYLTRLEQGRDRHPSPQVLGALSDALQLSAEGRQQLLHLAKASGDVACPAAVNDPPARSVRPTVRALLDQLAPAPAYVVNRLGDLLAVTTGYEQVAGPSGVVNDDAPARTGVPNLARYVFTDSRARAAFPDWQSVASDLAAGLSNAVRLGDRHAAELVAELRTAAGAKFSERFDAASAGPASTGVLRIVHPEAGELRLAYETLELPQADDQSLVVFLPADAATSEALEGLHGRRSGARRAGPD